MKRTNEYDKFNRSMDTILRADPKAVKEAMEKEKKANEEERVARGERKRGRHSNKQKPLRSSDSATSSK